jgi:hypothetical protein
MGVASLGKDGLHGNTAAGNDHDSGSKKGADRPLLFYEALIELRRVVHCKFNRMAGHAVFLHFFHLQFNVGIDPLV